MLFQVYWSIVSASFTPGPCMGLTSDVGRLPCGRPMPISRDLSHQTGMTRHGHSCPRSSGCTGARGEHRVGLPNPALGDHKAKWGMVKSRKRVRATPPRRGRRRLYRTDNGPAPWPPGGPPPSRGRSVNLPWESPGRRCPIYHSLMMQAVLPASRRAAGGIAPEGDRCRVCRVAPSPRLGCLSTK